MRCLSLIWRRLGRGKSPRLFFRSLRTYSASVSGEVVEIRALDFSMRTGVKAAPDWLINGLWAHFSPGMEREGLTPNGVKCDINWMVFLKESCLRIVFECCPNRRARKTVVSGDPLDPFQIPDLRWRRGRRRRGFRRTATSTQTMTIRAAVPLPFRPVGATTLATIPTTFPTIGTSGRHRRGGLMRTTAVGETG